MWQSIWKVVTITSPTFFYGYIGDIFTSMVKVFQDIAWTVCWVFTGSFTNSEDLKKGIEWMSKKIDEKKNFKHLSKNQVEKFDPKVVAQQYIKIYSEIL